MKKFRQYHRKPYLVSKIYKKMINLHYQKKLILNRNNFL